MAIFHFSAKVISRAAGSSALAAAAYRSASRLHDQRLGRTHDFTNKAGVVHSEVMLPEGADEAWRDRDKLWNAVEATELRKDAQLAREIEFAIPRELDQEQGIRLARDFVEREFVARGMVADLNVHWDMGEDGLPKPHAHVMLTMREVTQDENGTITFGAKVRDWNRAELLTHWREAWGDHVNARLAELDIDARIDHRSLEAQGIGLEPQHKIGPAASRMLADGQATERVEDHLRIARENGARIIADPSIAIDAITHGQATFTNRDLARFVHRHSDGKEQFDRAMAAVRSSPDLVQLGRDGNSEDRFTSRTMIETEKRLENATIRLDASRRHGVDKASIAQALQRAEARGLSLSPEQRGALEHVTGSRGLTSVIGYAGTGKSAMLGVAREAWESTGYRVTGAALSGIAAENLEGGSGIASRTLASLEHQWGQERELLSARDVLVIDEAGMVGTRQFERIVREVEKRGAKLVLVGDPQQLQAIEAGAAFRSIAERHGAIEITGVRRQSEEWQRDATRQLATGRTAEAIEAYEAAGHVHAAPSREAARGALIQQWDADRQAYPDASRMILTHTNDEVRLLNEAARMRLRASGDLGEDISIAAERGQRAFAPGDRIMFLKNERSMGVKNGTLGTATEVSAQRMTVTLDDGKRVAFDLKDYAHVDHGYAATIHKSQGATLDRVHVLATPGLDAHASYVALSRHRTSVDLHYGKDDFADRDALATTLGRERGKDMASDYPARAEPTPEPRKSRFDGLRLRIDRQEIARPKSRFDGLKLSPQSPAMPSLEDKDRALAKAAQRYARAFDDIGRLERQGLPVLEYQKTERNLARQALDQIQPGASRDLNAAFERDRGLIDSTAKGRTAQAIQALQLEAEMRTNPEMRADRFVTEWQKMKIQLGRLKAADNDDARDRLERAMKTMAKTITKDPALAQALSKRGEQLIGRQWSFEWSPGSRDGGIGSELAMKARTGAIIDGLTHSLGRGRGIGI